MKKRRNQKIISRIKINLSGRVQGVGFRPFVYRLASEQELAGFVGNDTRGAFIEVEGTAENLAIFMQRLKTELPPAALISEMSSTEIPVRGEKSFFIKSSIYEGEQSAEILPDISICDDCLRELFDRNDRRYRYPFINCTNCGPRYSIIRGVPYDRVNTTMSVFKMCPDCRREYENPLNRRFHAQPNACPVCGPKVWLINSKGKAIEGDPIKKCVEQLKEGKIIAIKGIGGFHLACRADDDRAVSNLRERKGREAKPLALMAGSLEEIAELVEMDDASHKELESPIRPIVLMKKLPSAKISKHVAPENDCFGVMLPYSPLHYLIFAEKPGALVMTSGNPSEEPLSAENDEAITRLSSIADAFLLHNRDIEHRLDDSVAKVFSYSEKNGETKYQIIPLRRARGYVPAKIKVPLDSPETVLAVGGELKSVICLLKGNNAVLSEHLGELENPAAYRNFIRAIESLKNLLKLEPSVVGYDMHPGYSSTRYAQKLYMKKTAIQHHHAHIAGCAAENGISGRVIGIACDGTGYGADGTIWGCEVLTCDEISFERSAYLLPYPLLGGDYAARETWRPAAGLLYKAFGKEWESYGEFAFQRVDKNLRQIARRRLDSGKNVVMTSSLGRLFDAVSFLLAICDTNRYEAEAAMSLEALAGEAKRDEILEYNILGNSDGSYIIDWTPMLLAIVEKLRFGESASELAKAFHLTIATMLADAAKRIFIKTNINRVVISGGCFANRILLEHLQKSLIMEGFEVFIHKNVPTGDGGIALGQAVIAAERAKRGCL